MICLRVACVVSMEVAGGGAGVVAVAAAMMSTMLQKSCAVDSELHSVRTKTITGQENHIIQ